MRPCGSVIATMACSSRAAFRSTTSRSEALRSSSNALRSVLSATAATYWLGSPVALRQSCCFAQRLADHRRQHDAVFFRMTPEIFVSWRKHWLVCRQLAGSKQLRGASASLREKNIFRQSSRKEISVDLEYLRQVAPKM